MKIIVDTCVWSLAFRRKSPPDPATSRILEELIRDYRAQMIGPVRQELLSGIRSANQFELLKNSLKAFSDIPIITADYEQAAEFLNFCRTKGVQGSNTDFLVCAVATRSRMPIYTTDNDFILYKKHLPISLFPMK